MEDTTDEDICQAVKASLAAEENMLSIGVADDDDDNSGTLSHPSRKAALEAAATLEIYISASVQEDLESYVRKLGILLMSFGLQTCFEGTQSLVNTLITHHFHN